MRVDRDAGRVGNGRDIANAGNTAAGADVGLGDIEPAGLDQRVKAEQGVFVLAAGDGNRGGVCGQPVMCVLN